MNMHVWQREYGKFDGRSKVVAGHGVVVQEREDTQALRRGTDEEIDGIMKQLSDLTYQSQDAADYDQ
jgi:hypothetical protein